MDLKPDEPTSTEPPNNPAVVLREFQSAELLAGAKEILIHHAGEIYRLRLTKNDKLILQK
jgi:hemin uptake protein HemP